MLQSILQMELQQKFLKKFPDVKSIFSRKIIILIVLMFVLTSLYLFNVYFESLQNKLAGQLKNGTYFCCFFYKFFVVK